MESVYHFECKKRSLVNQRDRVTGAKFLMQINSSHVVAWTNRLTGGVADMGMLQYDDRHCS